MIWFILGSTVVIMGIAYLSLSVHKSFYEGDEWDSLNDRPKTRKERSDKGKTRKPYTKKAVK